MAISEFEIIERYFSALDLQDEQMHIVLGIGDDGAVLDTPTGYQQCISTDLLLESIHFPAAADPFLLGQRALAVNLSDLAAMGAEPLCFTLGIALPGYDEHWLTAFSKGLSNIAQQYHCPLVGGDTTRGSLTISIQVHGLVKSGQALRRDGANVGDHLLVTGSLGKGALALAALGVPVHFDHSLHEQLATLGSSENEKLQQYFYSPQPRLGFARQAAPLINAALDISDGLAGDLQHILDRSRVGARVYMEKLPLDSLFADYVERQQRQSAALYGGDDYELCLTVAAENLPDVHAIAEQHSLALTDIGEIEAEPGLRLVDAAGNQQDGAALSFDHFKAGQDA